MLESLDGPALRRWMRSAWRGMGRERADIDALNVYPVADSDTGTNLHLTLEAVVATAGADDSAGESEASAALSVMARGALVGARGNSGVILAQYLRGMAAGFAQDRSASSCVRLAAGLAAAAELAREAVAAPVDGTILSVADAAADAARTACVVGIDDLATVTGAATAAAREALARTPSQLAVLREAGVVDAGGRGLVVILDALVATVVDADVSDLPLPPPVAAPAVRPVAMTHDAMAFEVMYGLEADEAAAVALRARLAELGDSVVVSGGDGVWAVHVHLADAGAAVDAGIDAGRVSSVRVTPLEVEVPAGRSVVVIAPGDGLAALFTSAGASVVRATNGEPTISELRAAVRACGAGEVVLLPSGRAAGALAEHIVHTSPADGPRVRVVPTRAVVQSLAALAVHDPARAFDDDVIAMTAAAVSTRYGSLTHAVREALTSAGRCSPGDVLGMVGDDVVTFGRDIDPIASEVIDRLLAAGGEMVTLVTGAGATAGLVDAVTARLRRTHPGVEVIAYDGGQPDHPLLVGVE